MLHAFFTLGHVSTKTKQFTSTTTIAAVVGPISDENQEASTSNDLLPQERRSFLISSSAFISTTIGIQSQHQPSYAAVTDETSSFADTWWNPANSATSSSSSYRENNNPTTVRPPPAPQAQAAPPSDEILMTFDKQDILNSGGGLGIELSEVEFVTNLRVVTKSIRPNSLADRMGIRKDWVVVSVNGQSAERTNAEGVTKMVSNALRKSTTTPLQIVFRDPTVFRDRLQNMSPDAPTVTTQVAPAGDTTQRMSDGSIRVGVETTQVDQKVTVEQLIPARICRRTAEEDDLLEISYIGTVVETGMIFDGSAVKINGVAIPGRGDDVSLYFVLGKQPFGQFPPGWDVGLVGMCVGERRRVIIPPVLAYGSIGVPKRGIPPDATLQYDITLVSINGLSTP